MSEYVNEVNDENFEKVVLRADVPVLVDFWAAWCGPCRVLAPTVDAVAAEHSHHARVVKLNVDDSPSVAHRFQIRGIPTLILFKGGEEKERLIGVTRAEEISRAIDKHLNPASN
jgi:thioredoxin 1